MLMHGFITPEVVTPLLLTCSRHTRTELVAVVLWVYVIPHRYLLQKASYCSVPPSP